MVMILTYVFWLSLGLTLYVYIGYPLLIDCMARIWPRPVYRRNYQSDYLPVVTVVIPAYNEERWIERKIENTLSLDYPHDRMQILVASDGSTDDTVGIVGQFSSQGVELVHYPERVG